MARAFVGKTGVNRMTNGERKLLAQRLAVLPSFLAFSIASEITSFEDSKFFSTQFLALSKLLFTSFFVICYPLLLWISLCSILRNPLMKP